MKMPEAEDHVGQEYLRMKTRYLLLSDNTKEIDVLPDNVEE
jgi:hypothetical protein